MITTTTTHSYRDYIPSAQTVISCTPIVGIFVFIFNQKAASKNLDKNLQKLKRLSEDSKAISKSVQITFPGLDQATQILREEWAALEKDELLFEEQEKELIEKETDSGEEVSSVEDLKKREGALLKRKGCITKREKLLNRRESLLAKDRQNLIKLESRCSMYDEGIRNLPSLKILKGERIKILKKLTVDCLHAIVSCVLLIAIALLLKQIVEATFFALLVIKPLHNLRESKKKEIAKLNKLHFESE